MTANDECDSFFSISNDNMVYMDEMEQEKEDEVKSNSSNSPNSMKKMYGSNQNLFDPTKISPPNKFLNKLRKRIASYNNICDVGESVISGSLQNDDSSVME